MRLLVKSFWVVVLQNNFESTRCGHRESLVHLRSPLLHSTNDWRPNSLSYHVPVSLLCHHMSAIITDCNRSPMLSLRFDLLGFWPGTEMKWEVWLLQTWFGIVPVNKLVSLRWLLWALRSFWRFTLHYIGAMLDDLGDISLWLQNRNAW